MKSTIDISAAYKENDVSTADPRKLIVMLYEGAIRFLDIALKNMHYSTYDVCNTNIIKTQNIITELLLSLNREKGGEIAQNLSDLYLFLNKELLEANIYKTSEKIIFVRKILSNLKEAWENIEVSSSTTMSPQKKLISEVPEKQSTEKYNFSADC